MSDDVRRCLGCQATYPAGEQVCPKCGSHAAEVEKAEEKLPADLPEAKPKPARRRRT
jgi:predicted amidophosphoribosyltransferase